LFTGEKGEANLEISFEI